LLDEEIKPALADHEYNNRQKSGDKEDVKYYLKSDIAATFNLVCHFTSHDESVKEV